MLVAFSRWRFQAVALTLAAICLSYRPARGDEFPRELVRFRPFRNNPVFTSAGPGQWDAKIRERGWILREGDRWRMWYTGYDGTASGTRSVGLATSRDGLTWTRDSANPICRNGWVEDVQVVKHADTYLMFAEGLHDRAQWLSSRDGIEWKREGPFDVRTTNGSPLSDGPFGTPTVWFENGQWHLFYERNDDGVWLARSTDLRIWTNVQEEPVLSPGPDPYDRLKIALNQIIRHDGRYYAYYHGSGIAERPRTWTTNVAVSTDLVRWKKYGGNPLVPERDNKSSGIVVFDDDSYRLYTMHDQVDAYTSAP
ncbi:MAG: glycosylase [Planctomycetaceae bacterium]